MHESARNSTARQVLLMIYQQEKSRNAMPLSGNSSSLDTSSDQIYDSMYAVKSENR